VLDRGYRFVALLEERASDTATIAPAPLMSAKEKEGDQLDCPRCHHGNAAGAKFCMECGIPIQGICPYCHHPNAPGSKFCGECGQVLSRSALFQGRDNRAAPLAYTPRHLAEQILTTRSALEGERKQVTVLFCDLSDSVGLADRLGPEPMHALLHRFFELALEVVHRYEGTINQFLGDGFMALFGAPLAHEDHARRGVRAALELQASVQAHQDDFVRLQEEAAGVTPRQLQLRLGLNTGMVVVGSIGDNLRMDYTAVGDTTNLAARLQQLAEPGVLLISEATAKLVQAEVHLEALGPVYIKGKAEPVSVFRVLGQGPQRSALETRLGYVLSRFVGRDRELQTLHEFLAQVECGQGQVVGLVAEPGMGKSRLLYEFLQSLTGKDVAYIKGHCVSYGSMMPYLPVLNMLRHDCGITETDGPAVIAAQARQRLQEIDLAADEGVAYLFRFLGLEEGAQHLAVLSSETIKSRTLDILCQMSLKRSKQQPLIIVVEDLHWIDQSSEDFFVALVENLAGAAILLLITYRPGYQPPWIGKSYVTQVALQRLALADSLTLVYSVLKQDAFPQHLAQMILEKADGNPLFLEELTRATIEQGGLFSDATVPDTIQSVLMARIDRLPDAPKRLLQTASVLGRTFSIRLLQAIWDEPGALDTSLRELKRLEFLYEENSAAESVYVFKHTLTQEVAYDSLLTSRRQRLHAAAAQALECMHAERLEDAYDHLAYHYSKAEHAEKAAVYLTRFAEKAAKEHAHVEAILALQGALIHCARLPTDHQRERLLLDLHLRLALSLAALGRYQETLERLLQQQDHVEQLHDSWLTGRYALLHGQVSSYLGDWQEAARRAQQAVAEAAQCHDQLTLGQAYHVLAMERYWTGQPEQGVEYGQRAIVALQGSGEDARLGMAYFVLGLNALSLGNFESALEAAARAGAIGEAVADRRLQTFAAWTTGWVQATRGKWEAGIAACQLALERSSDPLNTAFAMGWLGYAYLEKGDPAMAIPLLEQATQSMRHFGYQRLEGLYTTLLGEAHRLRGDLDMTRDLALQGLTIALETPYGAGTAWAQRTLGCTAQAAGALEEAEHYLKEALSTFTAMQARFEVGRTHLALAELAQRQGNREAAARDLIAARHLFIALRVPTYVQHAEQRARELALSFPVLSADP
jgi:class 3 adenylate cyclase/tetratricopeptide (TPR) repeat protein